MSFVGGATNVSNLFVVGCTNFKNAIDSAFLRPGRIEKHYFLGKMSKRAREEFIIDLISRLRWPNGRPECSCPTVAAQATGSGSGSGRSSATSQHWHHTPVAGSDSASSAAVTAGHHDHSASSDWTIASGSTAYYERLGHDYHGDVRPLAVASDGPSARRPGHWQMEAPHSGQLQVEVTTSICQTCQVSPPSLSVHDVDKLVYITGFLSGAEIKSLVSEADLAVQAVASSSTGMSVPTRSRGDVPVARPGRATGSAHGTATTSGSAAPSIAELSRMFCLEFVGFRDKLLRIKHAYYALEVTPIGADPSDFTDPEPASPLGDSYSSGHGRARSRVSAGGAGASGSAASRAGARQGLPPLCHTGVVFMNTSISIAHHFMQPTSSEELMNSNTLDVVYQLNVHHRSPEAVAARCRFAAHPFEVCLCFDSTCLKVFACLLLRLVASFS
jgi:hypothetical protein